jgi:serine/threonine protein kinase
MGKPGGLNKALIDELIQIFVDYKGAKETLDVYNSSGKIVDSLLNTPRGGVLCPFMNIKSKHVKFTPVGSGRYGEVFSVKFPCMESQRYVVKVPNLSGPLSEDVGCKISNSNENNYTMVDKNSASDVTGILITDNRYLAMNGKYYPILIDKSYLCYKETYSEYIIGILTGQLYRNGMYRHTKPQRGSETRSRVSNPLKEGREVPPGLSKDLDFSINFTNIFDFVTCYKPEETQYMFMQEIDTTLEDEKLDSSFLISERLSAQAFVFMQVLFAIRAYQSYNISHNDLRLDNIFLEKITKNTKYNGEYIRSNDYLEFKFGDESFYLEIPPTDKYIVKIGDWGMAVKYGKDKGPTVGFFDVLMGEFDGIVNKANIPNWFAPAHDLFTFLNFMGKKRLSISTTSRSWLEWMTQGHEALEDKFWRPMNDTVSNYKNVKDMLNEAVFDNYKVRPRGKILTVCNIKNHSI